MSSANCTHAELLKSNNLVQLFVIFKNMKDAYSSN